MKFNFKTFSVLAEKAYQDLGDSSYTLDEVLSVFECYFEQYERYMGQQHPNLRIEQIRRIIQVMPHLELDTTPDLDADCYPEMIDRHFQTKYRHCDYRINHFFSGCVRINRFYETCL